MAAVERGVVHRHRRVAGGITGWIDEGFPLAEARVAV